MPCCCLQEYFVEDIAEFLLYIGRYKPRVLEGARLEEIAMFLVVFLASPEYVRNPYLRSKLAEVRRGPHHYVPLSSCLHIAQHIRSMF